MTTTITLLEKNPQKTLTGFLARAKVPLNAKTSNNTKAQGSVHDFKVHEPTEKGRFSSPPYIGVSHEPSFPSPEPEPYSLPKNIGYCFACKAWSQLVLRDTGRFYCFDCAPAVLEWDLFVVAPGAFKPVLDCLPVQVEVVFHV